MTNRSPVPTTPAAAALPRGTGALVAALAVMLGCATRPAAAQPMMPAGGPEGPRSLAPDKIIQTVGVDQKLDAQVSPDLVFKDETGKTVRLGDYMGKRPLLLSLVYYECPGLCTMSLNGISRAMKPLKFTPGKEFDLLTVSFDPRETPALAAKKKAAYTKDLKRPEAAAGWHFLTGDDANIRQLTQSVGFRYAYDERTKQYAHAAAIMVITPQGRVSRYFYGLEYSTRDIELGLIEASEERIGSAVDAAVLFCYAYDPAAGKYSLVIMRVLRVAAVATIAVLGTFLFVMIRRERRNRPAGGQPAAAGSTSTAGGTGSEILNPQ